MKQKITIIVPLDPNKSLGELENEIKKQGLKLIVKSGLNPSENRNLGVNESKTQLVAFINGHTKLSEKWAERVNEFFTKHPEIDIVGGPQLTPEKSKLFERASGYVLGSLLGGGEVSYRYKLSKIDLNADENMLTSANLICKKKVFEKVKFDEKLYPGEDPKFIADAKKAKLKVAYCPEIIVYNERRKNFIALAKQIFNYGKTRPQKESIKETLKKPYFLVPSLFLLYIIFILFYLEYAVFIKNNINFIILLPLFLYILLVIIFSIRSAAENRDILALFIMPSIYFTVHLSYGWGFLLFTLRNIVRK